MEKMNITELRKEIANSITHGFGVLFGIVCIPILIASAVKYGNHPGVVGASVFGFSFLMVYGFSTLYHSISNPVVKKVMKTLDHISIYFLIAGSYTPFLLMYSYNTAGFTVLSILWGLTLLGIFFKVFLIGKFEILSVGIYLAMGWMILFVPGGFREAIPDTAFILIAAGGISYTVGVIFYLWKKLTYHHAIWHLFVLGGSICHYVAVLLAVNA